MVIVLTTPIGHQGLEDQGLCTGTLFCAVLVRFEGLQQTIDAGQQAIVDDLFVFEGLNVVFPVDSLLVNLVLFCADEGTLVDVGMNLDIGVV